MKLANLILVMVYLLSGTVLSGYGRLSIQTNSISDKSSTPRQHFLNSQRLQKHIAPNFQTNITPDAVPNQVETGTAAEEVLSFVPENDFDLYSLLTCSDPTNKAPPLS